MSTLRSYLLAGALATSVALLAGCSTVPTGPDVGNEPAPVFKDESSMQGILDRGEVRIGVSFDHPLFGYVANPGDVPEGFEVELGKVIAHVLGLTDEQIVWTEATSSNYDQLLSSGTVDMVIASLPITDGAQLTSTFAGPYYVAGQSLLVTTGNATITGKADIVGKPVCVKSGSASETKIRQLEAIPVPMEKIADCVAPLRSGEVVAASDDNVLLEGLRVSNPGEFVVAGSPFTVVPYGVGIEFGSQSFGDFLNVVIKESMADGTYRLAWDRSAGTVLGFVDPLANEDEIEPTQPPE